jgi:hypothetical protein
MFFGRLFESDLMPAGLPQVQLLIGVVAFLGAPSLLAPILMGKKYVWFAGDPLRLSAVAATDRTIAMLLAILAIGVITLVIWEGIFPDKRDGRILGVLPISIPTLVVARLSALALVFAFFVAATALPAGFSFGIMASAFNVPGGLAGTGVSHFLATAGAEAVVFFGVVLLQCVILNTAGAAVAQRLAVVLQVAMVVGLFQLPLILPILMSPRIAAMAPLAALAVSAAALLLYAASYKRMLKLALEGTGKKNNRRPLLRWVVPMLQRMLPLKQPGRAVFAYTLRTAARSRQHRMLLAGWVGLALALILSSIVPFTIRNGWAAFARPTPIVLVAPLILAALTMTGLRMLFAIPAEIRANWAIRLRQPVPVSLAIDGAAGALIACGVLPAVLLALGSATLLWGVAIGIKHALFVAVLGVGLAEVLSIGLDKIPFTCTYMPGKGRLIKLWPLYLTLFSLYTVSMASLEAALMRKGGFAVGLGILFVLAVIAAIIRRQRASELPALCFEEPPLDALTLVSL